MFGLRYFVIVVFPLSVSYFVRSLFLYLFSSCVRSFVLYCVMYVCLYLFMYSLVMYIVRYVGISVCSLFRHFFLYWCCICISV